MKLHRQPGLSQRLNSVAPATRSHSYAASTTCRSPSHFLYYACRTSLVHRCTAVGLTTSRVDQISLAAAPDCTSFPQPSDDFKELCNLQLRTLLLLLRTLGHQEAFSASVFARCPESLEAGTLRLSRVVSLCSAQVLSDGSEPNPATDEPANQALSFQLAVDPQAAGFSSTCDASEIRGAESALLAADVLALPNSATLVLPLAYGSFLVGILVLEHRGVWCAPGFDTQANSSTAGGLECPVNLGLTEEELQCVRSVAEALAKACALEQRGALAAFEAAATGRAARGLLREARGSLAVLQTFGSMLMPRLQEGEPSRDMAQGVLLQGKRLQEVIRQLEAALRPGVPAPPSQERAMAPFTPPASGFMDGPGFGPALGAAPGPGFALPAPRYQQVLPSLPFGQPQWEAPPGLGGWDQAPDRQGPAQGLRGWDPVPARFQTQTQDTPASQPGTALRLLGNRSGPITPGLPGAAAGAVLGSALAAPASGSNQLALSPRRRAEAVAELSLDTGGGAAMGTIEVELDEGGYKVESAPPFCNVLEVAGHVLAAAQRLALVVGIAFSVLHPLCIPGKAEAARARGGVGGAGAGTRLGAEPSVLLPRPKRPLRVSAAAPLVRRVLSCVVDVALQCTPRGGRILVSASQRAAGGPVQVCVMHTGGSGEEAAAAAPPPGRRAAAAGRGTGGVYGSVRAPGADGRDKLDGSVPGSCGANLAIAQQLIGRVGGALRVTYPCEVFGQDEGSPAVMGTKMDLVFPGYA